ncbi:MAG TPA: YbfB/YjiJ family MFS transporter [Quisquiliibacterium sp.]|nr:YbfB/YjiJ family MFS transporter [Quisquiliibacterium sp.]
MTPAARATVAGMAALALGMGIGRFAYTPLLPALIADAGLSIEAAGDIAAANFAGYLIGAIAATRVPPAWRRIAFATAIAASILTTLLMAGLRAPVALGLTRAVAGVASAFVLVQGSSIILDVLARCRRPELFAWLYAGVGAGIALTAVIVEGMSRAHASGSATWIALGGASLLLAVPALRLRLPDDVERAPAPVIASGPAASGPAAAEPTAADRSGPDAAVPAAAAADRSGPDAAVPASHRSGPDAAASATDPSGTAAVSDVPQARARARALRLLTLAYGGLGFGYVITATFLVVIVRSRPDWKAWEMAVWFVVGAAAAPSNLLWLWVARRVGAWNAMTGAFLMQAIGVMAAVAGAHLAWVFVGAAFLGGTIVAITAMGLSSARELATGDSNRVLGTMTAAFGIGQIAGPAAGGRLAEATGSFMAPSVMAAVVLVASAVLTTLAARARRA